MRPIDADALIEDFENSGWQNLSWIAKHHWSHAVQLKDLLVKIIGQSPTINSEDLRPKGKWEAYPNDLYLRCSACRMEFYIGHFPLTKKYCPNCGADMEGIVCQDG